MAQPLLGRDVVSQELYKQDTVITDKSSIKEMFDMKTATGELRI